MHAFTKSRFHFKLNWLWKQKISCVYYVISTLLPTYYIVFVSRKKHILCVYTAVVFCLCPAESLVHSANGFSPCPNLAKTTNYIGQSKEVAEPWHGPALDLDFPGVNRFYHRPDPIQPWRLPLTEDAKVKHSKKYLFPFSRY